MSTQYSDWDNLSKSEGCYDESAGCALEEYITGSIAVQEAVERITLPPSSKPPLPASSHVGTVWTMILSCAQACPDDHAMLIDLLKTIFSLPKPDKKGAVDWSAQRTSFGHLWRDAHDCKPAQVF